MSPNGTASAASPARGAAQVELISKSGKPLARYFPDVDGGDARPLKADDYLLDGELIIPAGDSLSFEALQLRLHPAESRVRKLAAETPGAIYAVRPARSRGQSLADQPLTERREALETALSPRTQTTRPAASRPRPPTAGARCGGSSAAAERSTESSPSASTIPTGRASGRWSRSSSGGPPIASSAASATPSKAREVGSLLLGLYDEDGLLHHVGFTSAIPAAERARLTERTRGARGRDRLHRQGAGRPQPLEQRALRRNG